MADNKTGKTATHRSKYKRPSQNQLPLDGQCDLSTAFHKSSPTAATTKEVDLPPWPLGGRVVSWKIASRPLQPWSLADQLLHDQSGKCF